MKRPPPRPTPSPDLIFDDHDETGITGSHPALAEALHVVEKRTKKRTWRSGVLGVLALVITAVEPMIERLVAKPGPSQAQLDRIENMLRANGSPYVVWREVSPPQRRDGGEP